MLLVCIQMMQDYSLGSGGGRPYRTVDGISQVSSNTNNPALKPIQLWCTVHAQQPSCNYCIQNKCHQPLCSECIQEHLHLHKQHGLSDLAVKSIRGVRRDCVAKLSALIEELLKRLSGLAPPPNPEQMVQDMQNKLEHIKKEAHQIVEQEMNRISEVMKMRVGETATSLQGMAQIHHRLQTIIEQLKHTHTVLSEGKNTNTETIPDCLRKTLTLNEQGLLQTFHKEGAAYQNQLKKFEFELIFNPETLRKAVADSTKIVSSTYNPLQVNEATISQGRSRQRGDDRGFYESDLGGLPFAAQPQQNNKTLHFFETGSDLLHLVQVDGRRKGEHRSVRISEFVVPSFHASIASQTGQHIYLSGGIVELNSSKSPMFMRYNLRTQQAKKDFAKVIPRSSHSLCQDINGDILIIGGYGHSDKGEDPNYLKAVERVNERTGRVQRQPDSHWGGSNMALRCGDMVVKACDEGVELFSSRVRQWIVAEVRMKGRGEYFQCKNSGYAILREGQFVVFGGYRNEHGELIPSDQCSYWRMQSNGQRYNVAISTLRTRLPVAQGFDNNKAVVDEQGFSVLQNVEDDEQNCLDNQRRLLRFDLCDGEGVWKDMGIIEA